jgi:3-hydroxypropanoate dehydrogenase
MTVHSPERKSVGEAALAQLFHDARTHNGFLDKPVPVALLKEAVDIAKMGPTSVNQSPFRILFLTSQEAKDRLVPLLSPGNQEKTKKAPVVAIVAYDEKFYDHLPFLFPHADAKPWFSGNEAFASRSAFQNGTLQVGYLILALRAVGLDTGPMTGFDNAKVDAEFFPEGHVKSNVVINIGYGSGENLFPRSPRFAFDQIAKIL